VVTRNIWNIEPTAFAEVLYVGGNAKNPKQFRNRIGLLIKDMLGFWGEETGSHTGGHTLHRFCCEQQINPLDLQIAWILYAEICTRAETEWFESVIDHGRRPWLWLAPQSGAL
jgi:hypothetical protein